MDTLLADAADKLFTDIGNAAAIRDIENGGAADALWRQIEDSGFADVLLPEERGGAGLALPDAYPLMYAAGRHALPVPYAQTMLARAWLHAAGAAAPSGSIAIAGHGLRVEGPDAAIPASAFGRAMLGRATLGQAAANLATSGRVASDRVASDRVASDRAASSQATSGRAASGKAASGKVASGRVAFGNVAQWLLAEIDGRPVLLSIDAAERGPAASRGSLDAELRWDTLPADAGAGCTQDPACSLAALSAACMAALLAGAADRVLELTLAYANQRKQFGKPIGRFQAVQNQIAVMAERAWAARMAAQIACRSPDWRPAAVTAAIGKGVASEAAAAIADIGHAVHGAIGVTREYELQRYTRRLREWRLADGSETFWYRDVGAALLQTQGSALSFLCATLAAPAA